MSLVKSSQSARTWNTCVASQAQQEEEKYARQSWGIILDIINILNPDWDPQNAKWPDWTRRLSRQCRPLTDSS